MRKAAQGSRQLGGMTHGFAAPAMVKAPASRQLPFETSHL